MEKVINKGVISCPRCFLPVYVVKEQINEMDSFLIALEKIGSCGNLPKLRLDSPVNTICHHCENSFDTLFRIKEYLVDKEEK